MYSIVNCYNLLKRANPVIIGFKELTVVALLNDTQLVCIINLSVLYDKLFIVAQTIL